MIIFNKEKKFFYSSKLNLIHGFSTKQTSQFPYSEKRFFLEQIHSDRIVDINRNAKLMGDALIYQKKQNLPVGLYIKTADCLPVFLAAPQQNIIAAVHCGYRGIQKKILQKTVTTFVQKGVNPNQILAIVGPGIGECCYNKNGVQTNLLKKAVDQLQKAGIRKENIDYGVFCTRCQNELFYSYRAENKRPAGSNLNFIYL